jgi:hypothetical protein
MLSTTVKTNELKDVEVTFTKDILTSEKGQNYLILDNEKFNICLFPINSLNLNGKKSFIRYNARVHLKHSGILFYMAVRELVSDRALIGGQSGKTPGFRAVVTEYSRETGIAHERLSIPNSNYYELMSVIRAATKA